MSRINQAHVSRLNVDLKIDGALANSGVRQDLAGISSSYGTAGHARLDDPRALEHRVLDRLSKSPASAFCSTQEPLLQRDYNPLATQRLERGMMQDAAERIAENKLSPEQREQLRREREQYERARAEYESAMRQKILHINPPQPPIPGPMMQHVQREGVREVTAMRAQVEAQLSPEEKRQLAREREAYQAEWRKVQAEGGLVPDPGPAMKRLEQLTLDALQKRAGLTPEEIGSSYARHRVIDPGFGGPDRIPGPREREWQLRLHGRGDQL